MRLLPVKILSVVHERDAGSGVFAEVANERGDALSEWIPAEAPPPDLDGFAAALVFGGGMHVDELEEHPWLDTEMRLLEELLRRGTPTIGVCLGAQLLAQASGGVARRAVHPEIGWKAVELLPAAFDDAVLGALPARFLSFQWHSYEMSPPAGAVALARSATCLQAFRLASAPWWAIQFHAEVTLETLRDWIRDYAGEPEAVRSGLEPEAVLAETEQVIMRWNELGRELCARFLAYASDAPR